jgi:hypothetical protein
MALDGKFYYELIHESYFLDVLLIYFLLVHDQTMMRRRGSSSCDVKEPGYEELGAEFSRATLAEEREKKWVSFFFFFYFLSTYWEVFYFYFFMLCSVMR